MNRGRIVAVSAFVAGAVVAGATLFAQNPPPPGRGPGAGRMGGMGIPVRELNLTEAQQQQIRGIRGQYADALQQAESRVRAARQALQDAIETVPASEGVVRAASQGLVTAETELAIQQAHVYTDVWNALTPDQQAQLKKLQDQRKSSPGGRRGGPRGGGRGGR